MKVSELFIPLCEERLVKLFHVIEKRNLDSALRQGLKPRIGKRSRAAGETNPAIYAFTSERALEDALMNWAGEGIEGDLSLLELTVPESWVESKVGWEAIIERPIPLDMIKLVTDDIDKWKLQDDKGGLGTAPTSQRTQGVDSRGYGPNYMSDLVDLGPEYSE